MVKTLKSILIILCITIVTSHSCTKEDHENTPFTDICYRNININNRDTIRLDKLFPTEWDGLYIFYPFTPIDQDLIDSIKIDRVLDII